MSFCYCPTKLFYLEELNLNQRAINICEKYGILEKCQQVTQLNTEHFFIPSARLFLHSFWPPVSLSQHPSSLSLPHVWPHIPDWEHGLQNSAISSWPISTIQRLPGQQDTVIKEGIIIYISVLKFHMPYNAGKKKDLLLTLQVLVGFIEGVQYEFKGYEQDYLCSELVQQRKLCQPVFSLYQHSHCYKLPFLTQIPCLTLANPG